MYAGQEMESAPTDAFFRRPAHPYTRRLLASVPAPDGVIRDIPGEVPSLVDPPTGCRFHPRCPLAQEPLCSTEDPLLMPGPDRRAHLAACHFAWTATPPRHTPEILEEAT
jgi:oligopeptide/dipeptide ABC transporter ATP-binding protein